ncbi:MAG: hypothetical protein KDB22_20440 [Planctomycetales bacterium]|nr:hypothetical protein [Planctomycetales bacterium]
MKPDSPPVSTLRTFLVAANILLLAIFVAMFARRSVADETEQSQRATKAAAGSPPSIRSRQRPERKRGGREEEEQEEKEEEEEEEGGGSANGSYVVLGYNDLGMHCMNQDFSRLCILPPFNNLHAQVIRRGKEPDIVTNGVDVTYAIPSNTHSADKTNFWLYAQQLFGVALQPNVGLTGNGLSGVMQPTGNNDWSATGIPVTPIDDRGSLNPYPLSEIKVQSRGTTLATTHAVVPVSWEISCNLCHPNVPAGTPVTAAEVEFDILRDHDRMHNTTLELSAANGQSVLCASCHADPALGTPGVQGVSSLSHAMHGAHADRVAPLRAMGKNSCYACHPGFQTNCQRDIHFTKGIFCSDCHGNERAVANPARTPWVSQPTCGSCHSQRRPEFEFEERGKLFKDSRGHGNVHCSACHSSPHAIGPAVTDADNVQAIEHQGFAGTISQCTVCHTSTPHDPFKHKRD